MPRYQFTRNDPYDRAAQIEFVLPPLIPGRVYMESIRAFEVPPDGLAIWFFGQNGFILKASRGPLIGIDLYLSNSCARLFSHLPYRLDRQLPVFVEPEDLDIDVFFTTHSHDDHSDPDTIRRFISVKKAQFIGPWESVEKYLRCGVPQSCCRILHPNQTIQLDGPTQLTGTFALPTDNTDLNHTGVLIRFANGISFYNTGDTGYCELLESLLPRGVDLCAICINGGFQNLDPLQAARIVKAVDPAIVIPCHYDMMINNVGHPDLLRTALCLVGSKANMQVLDYYSPWVFRSGERA
jgi:L-ascorbate metabolism protein UlaG (beta-lactamase superfamily)